MIAEIDRAREAGDTLGGAFEVIATGVPIGLGSYVQWDRKLDGRLAQALMSIPAIKAVGVGIGPEAAASPRLAGPRRDRPRSLTASRATGLARPTNNAGGLEGGVTNGEDLRVSAYMKPISTLMKPLRSVDLSTMASRPPRSSAATSARFLPRRSSAKRWSRSCWPTRCSSASAATRSPRSAMRAMDGPRRRAASRDRFCGR